MAINQSFIIFFSVINKPLALPIVKISYVKLKCYNSIIPTDVILKHPEMILEISKSM